MAEKTYLCKEHGELFLLDAESWDEAEEGAMMYGAVVIKEVTEKDLKKLEKSDSLQAILD